MLPKFWFCETTIRTISIFIKIWIYIEQSKMYSNAGFKDASPVLKCWNTNQESNSFTFLDLRRRVLSRFKKVLRTLKYFAHKLMLSVTKINCSQIDALCDKKIVARNSMLSNRCFLWPKKVLTNRCFLWPEKGAHKSMLSVIQRFRSLFWPKYFVHKSTLFVTKIFCSQIDVLSD